MLNGTGDFQASPQIRRLAASHRRIGFVILRTVGSPPVAPHPASRRRSYLQLRRLWPPPVRTFTALTVRPHGRTDFGIPAEMTAFLGLAGLVYDDGSMNLGTRLTDRHWSETLCRHEQFAT